MPSLFRCLLLCGLLAPAGVFAEAPMPAPAAEPAGPAPAPTPVGYRRHASRDANVSVLVPDGWFVKEEASGGTAALFVTKQDIDDTGRFDTGLSLNAIGGMRDKAGTEASDYAQAFLDAIEAKHTVILRRFSTRQGDARTFGVRVRNDESGIVVHYVLVANDAEDTLHLFFFEAPTAAWDAAWAIGEPLLRDVRIGD